MGARLRILMGHSRLYSRAGTGFDQREVCHQRRKTAAFVPAGLAAAKCTFRGLQRAGSRQIAWRGIVAYEEFVRRT